MATVHIIPHTHWDREWYFSTEDSLVLLVPNVDAILDTLENNKKFPAFLLDGQTSLIEDYLKVKGENKNRIKNLIREGRLLIGPWYTQSDEMIVSGESIVRNLLYGTEKAEEFGGYMPIGYMPDSFGQSAQMPQIFKGFDINSVVLWRGVCDLDTDMTEFYWEAPNGDKVFVLQLRFGYGSGQNLKTDEADIKGRVMKIVGELTKLTDTGHVVLPNGGDQVPIQKDLCSIVETINSVDKDNEYIISSYSDVLKLLQNSGAVFNTLKGEFTKPKNMRVHKSIYSTRYDLKVLNSSGENKLISAVEPISVIANILGLEYPKGLVERAWKFILENQAHDSIGGCNSDSTNEDIKNRGKKAHEIIDGLLNFTLKKMAGSIKAGQEGSKLIIFNTMPYSRNTVFGYEITTQSRDFCIFKGENIIQYAFESQKEINGGLYNYMTADGEKSGRLPNYYVTKVYIKADELPALGYETYYIKELQYNPDKFILTNEDFIENCYYKVYIKQDGAIRVYDKLNDRYIDRCLIFEDSGNDGDEYNYSPPSNDLCISSENNKYEVKLYKSKIAEKAEINTIIKAPTNLENRNKGVIDGEIEIRTEIVLNDYNNFIHFKVNIENNIEDHKLRVLFNTGIKSEYSYADTQFGIVKREINLSKQLEDYRKNNWKELPINIEPMLSMVELNNDNEGVALLTNGIKEYQIVEDNNDIIALTLLSSVGVLGKDNLLWRPGRASGINNTIVYTKDAQVLGKSCFEFALYMHRGDINESKALSLAKKLNNYDVIYQQQNLNTLEHRLDRFDIPSENIEIPGKFSLFKIDKHLVFSTLKQAEDKSGYIVRVFNPYMKPLNNAFLSLNINVVIQEMNLAERAIGDKKSGRIFNLGNFNSCEVKTFKLELR